MSLEFGDGTFYSRIWFITGDQVDWLGALFRKPGAGWEIRYRFRYYADSGNDDDDKKSWYGGLAKEGTSEADCLKSVRVLVDVVQARFGGEMHELVLQTADFAVINEALRRERWCHFQSMKMEHGP